MKILITNDDGVESEGIWALAKSVANLGQVTIVAPKHNKSGTSGSITFLKSLRVEKQKNRINGIECFSVDGTPADSAIIALKEICKDPTIVLSGINNGFNLSRNILISGTIGAAMIANTQGKKSIAFSSESFESINNHHFQKMINRIVKECISENIPNETFLNINFPEIKDEKIGNAVETIPENSTLRITTDQVSKNEYKILLSQLQSQKSSDSKDKTDMKTVKNGLVSITLLNGNNFSQIKSEKIMERILKAANKSCQT
jgi:5'-nucleotidase